MEHKCAAKEREQKENAAPFGAASCSIKGAGGGRYECFRAAFPHDYHLALGDYNVDDTDCKVLES